MARFDNLLDSVLEKSKEIATAVGDKASVAVEYARLKYRQGQIETALEKTYAKLGAIVYEERQNEEDFTPLINKAIEDISHLNRRYDQLEEALALVGKQNQTANGEEPRAPIADTLDPLDDLDCPVCESDSELIEPDFEYSDFFAESKNPVDIPIEGDGEEPKKDISIEIIDPTDED